MTKCVLGDVADVIISGVDKKTKDGEERVRLCNYTDVYYNWAITGDKHDGLMEASAKPEEIRKFKIRKGQVALTKDSETRDDIGIPTYIADDFEDVILGYHCALITPHGKQLDGSYLNALLRTKYAKEFFANNAGGSGQRYYLSEASIRELPLFLPDVAEQKRIGKFLSSIDRKIALNRKRIATLEAMAKEIYDYWFVQFDFPNAHGRPYKSSGGAMVYNPDLKREIPKGWEVVPLGELISVCNGKDHKVLSVGRIPVYGSGGIMRRVDQMLYEGESVLIPRKGTLNNIMYVNGPLWCIDTMFYTKPKVDNVMKYIFMTIKDWDFASMDTGSAVPSMTAGIINKLLVARPADVFLEKFENQMRPLFLGMSLSEREIAKLTSLRDFLLPVLMNGQVKAG